LWVRVDDYQGKALSKQTIFLRELLSVLNRGFDRLLGNKLFSVRSIIVTFCYSWASAVFLNVYAERFRTGARPANLVTALSEWIIPTLFLTVGTLAATLNEKRMKLLAITFFPILCGYLSSQLFHPEKMGYYDSPYFAIAAFVGCACDIVFVALNRSLFRFGARLSSGIPIVGLLGANLLIGSLYAAPYWYWWYIYTIDPPGFLFRVSSANLLAVCCALSIVGVMLMALVHRVSWPVLSRPIYSIARRQLVQQPKLLISVAIVLLAWAIPAWKPFWEFLGK